MGHMSAMEWPTNRVDATSLSEIPDVIVEEQIRAARQRAYEYHDGQPYDETCGINFYEGHLAPVAKIGEMLCRITGASRLNVAGLWLHDGWEDGRATLEQMNADGIIVPVTDQVDILTRRPGEPYGHYMQRVAADQEAALRKLADSTGNWRVNLEFHDHEPLMRVRKRFLRYPKNVAMLAPIVFGTRLRDEQTQELERVPVNQDEAIESLVSKLVHMRQVLAFDGRIPEREIPRQLLTHPREIAFLLSEVMGETIDLGVVAAVRNGVLHAAEMV